MIHAPSKQVKGDLPTGGSPGIRAGEMNTPLAILCPTQGAGSGAEHVLALLLRGAAPRCGAPPLVLCPEDSAIMRAAADAGCAVLPWRADADNFAQNTKAFLLARRQLPRGVRLVHAWTARCFEWAVLLARSAGAGAAGTLHDHPRAPFHGIARRALMQHAAGRLRFLVCVSQALREACAPWRRPPLHVIPNGLPLAPPALRREGGPLRIGFAGMHAGWKGFETIAAWALSEWPTPVQWHLFGEPAAEIQPALRALLAKARDAVVAHGRVPADDIFAQIDVLAHPSVFFDPLPTALIEAARAGIPAVASDAGGTSEVVASGVTGFIFPPSEPARGLECLRRLAADPLLRRRMGDAARSRFESEFTIGPMVDSYLAIWRPWLHNPPPI